MDRDRLKDIQTADLSESKVNEDFVYWLKTKGPSYLFIILIVLSAFMFYNNYKAGKVAHRVEAWIAYIEAGQSGLPASLEDVAQTYSEIDSLKQLGLLSAADGYMRSVTTGQALGSDDDFSTELSEEDRTFYLEKADALYALVVAEDDKSPGHTLLTISGLHGRASVSESKGDIDSARGFYETVVTRSGQQYPALASQAQTRIDSLESLTEAVILPTDAEVAAWNKLSEERESAPINPSIDELTDLSETGQ